MTIKMNSTRTLRKEDMDHLCFIYARLKQVYHEDENLDWMKRFKRIIDENPMLERGSPVLIHIEAGVTGTVVSYEDGIVKIRSRASNKNHKS